MASDSGRFYVVATQPGTTFRLAVEAHGTATAGRDPINAVLLAHPLVSRRHARFALLDGGLFLVEDLESRNGTNANGEPIAGTTTLTDPAVIEIGPFVLSLSTSLSEETLTAASATATKVTRTMLDRGPRQFHVDGSLVLDSLSLHEYALLDLLEMRSPNVVERTAVGDAVWGAGQWDVYMLHNLVSRIRKRIAAQGAADSVIVTVPGVGYRLE
ncbi:MAG: FHA domain-containing protein [Dehalococcoidia bacterium]